MQERREEMRRRIEEERKRKAEEAGETIEEEPEYVPFGMDPQEKAQHLRTQRATIRMWILHDGFKNTQRS